MGSPLRSGQDQSSTLPSSSVTQPQLIPQQGQLSAGTGYLNVAPQSSVHSASVDTSLWTGFAGNFQQRSQPAGTSSFATSTSAPASSSRIPLPAASTNIFGNAPVDSGDEQSHGTLVISHTGRSKYLGPTAASEWLKDVSFISMLTVDGWLSDAARGRGTARDTNSIATDLAHSSHWSAIFSSQDRDV